MFKKIKNALLSPETLKYILFGVLTTAVDFGSFALLNDVFKVPSKDLSEFLSQFIAMIFAFITNKIIVFENHSKDIKNIFVLFIQFAAFRIGTILLNNALFYIFSTKFGYNEYLVKAAASVIVVILNYIFTKVLFRKKENKA